MLSRSANLFLFLFFWLQSLSFPCWVNARKVGGKGRKCFDKRKNRVFSKGHNASKKKTVGMPLSVNSLQISHPEPLVLIHDDCILY